MPNRHVLILSGVWVAVAGCQSAPPPLPPPSQHVFPGMSVEQVWRAAKAVADHEVSAGVVDERGRTRLQAHADRETLTIRYTCAMVALHWQEVEIRLNEQGEGVRTSVQAIRHFALMAVLSRRTQTNTTNEQYEKTVLNLIESAVERGGVRHRRVERHCKD